MSKRQAGGSVRKSKYENDIYFNYINAFEMFSYLYPHFSNISHPFILDACAGDGVLSNAIRDVSKKVCSIICQDIKEYGESILYYDAPTDFNIIVCNPPWIPVEEAEKIYHHLLSLLTDDGILFFIINNVFCYQGWKRAKELKFQKFYFLPRFTFLSSGKPLLDCGVLVYHKNNEIPKEAVNLDCFINLTKIRKSI